MSEQPTREAADAGANSLPIGISGNFTDPRHLPERSGPALDAEVRSGAHRIEQRTCAVAGRRAANRLRAGRWETVGGGGGTVAAGEDGRDGTRSAEHISHVSFPLQGEG